MQAQTRRTVLKTTGGAVVLGTLAGCTGGGGDDEGDNNESAGNESDDSMDEGAETMANLRVAHLAPDAPNVDVYVDGDAVLEDVPYRAVSDYLELAPGTYDVMITAAGDADTVVFDDQLEIPAGDFTVAALGELAEENQPFAPVVLEDDLSDPGEMARVRLVHASPDAPAVDVTVHESGDALFEGVEFGGTATAEVPAGSYTLEVRPATENNDGEVVATFDVELMAGAVYSAFAVGYLSPGDAPADAPFDLEVVVDAEAGSEMSQLRAAHMSPDAPNVDVYVDGDAVLEDVPYRAVSDYLELATGSHDVMITAAGDAETVVFDETIELSSGAYSAVALGELAEQNQPFSVELYENDLSDPGEMARVSLVHTSPDAPAVDVTVAGSGDALYEDVGFAEAATAEVPAGSYTLEVRPATENNDGEVAATFDVEVMAGTVYSAFAVGYLMPDDAPADVPFDLEVVVDAEAGGY
ncbi:protein of unknown function [Natronoarchaeum philippinense]|uniref:DUF4397 domain-containing protein n=1 Tax=Natronoarchaeum philippinense TaxID=558529 RepID=A0A285NZ40_NATPI|nr:DUF4397 domain-containing protein [Natronoarchaeum philippinense]SNZ12901.1 protein of unknown function [Natronoarchaeum philippinense]